MKKFIVTLTLSFLCIACANKPAPEDSTPEKSQQAESKTTDINAYQNVPQGWSSELIPLPFDFAPEIDLVGAEEILFMPGMYNPAEEDYFSYAFAWILTQSSLDNETIKQHLLAYYSGLYKAVAKEDSAEVNVEINEVAGNWPLTGVIDWTEPFISKQNQKLFYHAKKANCDKINETRWYFIVSPQNTEHSVWDDLKGLELTKC